MGRVQPVLFEVDERRAARREDPERQARVRAWLEERAREGQVLTRAITIRQPWLRLTELGLKRWEFRGRTHGRMGWTIMLHGGKQPDPDWRAILGRYNLTLETAPDYPLELPGRLGAVCMVGVLGRCAMLTAPGGWPWPEHELSSEPGYPRGDGLWYGWEWRELVPLIEPVPCSGAQGFWAPSERVRREVIERIDL